MNVKTEKWRIELVELVQRCFVKKINSEEYTIDRHALIEGTLKACKGSGLMFVSSDVVLLEGTPMEEIDV